MNKIALLVLLLVALLGAQVASAQDVNPGALLNAELETSYELSDINEMINAFYEADQVVAGQYPVDVYRVSFETVYKEDEPLTIVAQMFVPQVDEAAEFPVLVFGAGSSGINDQCAPSLEQPAVQNWGSYRLYMLTMATQGYIAILPDYAGFNNPDIMQPYYVSDMAGHVMLDAARVVAAWSEADTESLVDAAPAVLMSGYSQGGQSVFAARDLWETYAPDVPLKGIIGFAPVTNMASHMQTLPQLSAYRMVAWEDYYGIDQVDPSKVFLDMWLPTLHEDVMAMCVFDAAGHFSANPAELYRPEILEGLQQGTLDEVYPTLDALLELNSPGFVTNDIPSLIVQGTEDRTIPMQYHEQFVERYCEAGNFLNEHIYEGANHFHLREISYRDSLDWMTAALAGDFEPNTCVE